MRYFHVILFGITVRTLSSLVFCLFQCTLLLPLLRWLVGWMVRYARCDLLCLQVRFCFRICAKFYHKPRYLQITITRPWFKISSRNLAENLSLTVAEYHMSCNKAYRLWARLHFCCDYNNHNLSAALLCCLSVISYHIVVTYIIYIYGFTCYNYVQAHCLTERIHDIDLLTLDTQSVAEVRFLWICAPFMHFIYLLLWIN